MNKQTGFTLIELVIVISILGILAAIAVPKFVDLQDDALQASKKGMSGAVKGAHAISIAEFKRFPTVTEVAGNVNGENVTAVATGVQVDIDGSNYIVPTFTASNCTGATTAVGDTVQCVGTIPHP
jgi:MSHA pilin protein MshA